MLTGHHNWKPDSELENFETQTLIFPDDYDGAVTATLIRCKANIPTDKAVLHIHGYTDYFFQTHLAEQFLAHGYNFYALDLRKYGRSLTTDQHPNFCKDITEYFAEISASIKIIVEADENEHLLLSGHSTGGLISVLYAESGEYRQFIKALFLNSSFFNFKDSLITRMLTRVLSFFATFSPYLALRGSNPVPYIQSIHTDHHGEWNFNLKWRPLTGFPIFAGWCRAIYLAHKRVRQGLDIQCPVLVMHSDKTVYDNVWSPDFQTADSILTVDHIRDGSRHLGANVKVVEIEDGLHDLVLSRQDVRQNVFDELFMWLATQENFAIEN